MQKSKNLHEKIDTIFDEVGSFGPYQLAIIIICGGLGMIEAINAFSGGFYTNEPSHRCKLPGWELNDTYEIQNEYHQEMIQKYIPPPKDEFLGDYDQCKFRSDESENVTLESCNSWVFSKKYFKETMISKVRKY